MDLISLIHRLNPERTDLMMTLRDAVIRRRRDTRARGRLRSSAPLLLLLLTLLTLLSGCAAPVRVEWSTETEMNTAGFNLYRGESVDGPFDVKVNAQLIAPAADPLTGGKYEYVDKTARPGITYYYRLEEVERNGGTNSFGPISVRAGGLAWWHVLVLALLAAVAVALWLLGGRKEARKRSQESAAGGSELTP